MESHIASALHPLFLHGSFCSVQFSSIAQLCLTLCDPMDCSMPGFPVLQHLLELAQTHVHWVSDVIQPSHPLLSLFPPTFNLSQHQSLFVNFHIRRCETPGCVWNYWSFSLSVNPSNEYSGLISFRMDWLDLLAVQGTLKSLQHHISKASIIWGSDFFMVQLSHPYMTTGKPIALTRWIKKMWYNGILLSHKKGTKLGYLQRCRWT